MPRFRHSEGRRPKVIDLSQLEDSKPQCPIKEGTCVLCQEILGVEKDIADAVSRLEDLLSHYRRLKTDTNRTHSPIIRDLPVEVLSKIFHLCFSDKAKNASWIPNSEDIVVPLKIGAVYRTWRHVAWSSPELWTCVVLSRRLNSSPHVCNQYDLMQGWISRSGALPLTVYIYEVEEEGQNLDVEAYSLQRNAEECRCWEKSLERMAQCSDRWKAATLTLSTYSYERIASTSTLKPPVRNLILDSSGDCGWQPRASVWRDGLKLLQEPSFSPLRVTTRFPVQFKTFNVDWQHVQLVQSDGWSIQECLDLLKCASQLVSCRFGFVSAYDEEFQPRAGEPVTCHASLQELTFHCCEDDAEFFGHVTLPSLRDFTYPAYSFMEAPAQIDDPSLIPFFTRSSFPLSTLSLTAHSFTPEYMVAILGTVPSLEHLKLSCSHHRELVDDTRNLMAFFLEHLAATATSPTTPPGVALEGFFRDSKRWSLTEDGSLISFGVLLQIYLEILRRLGRRVEDRSNHLSYIFGSLLRSKGFLRRWSLASEVYRKQA
ncbi:hypothetical protein CPC08DRAFT_717133 [Agrocybe pediades]|nr:hypothetical protein CPC08DRAFT_717133 [Agrocybe pediades]